MNRRQFITGCAVAATAATAGCLDSLPIVGDDGPDTDSPEGVVEAHIDAQEELYSDPESAQERLSEITHSQSPQRPQEDEGTDFAENGEMTVTSINGINTRLRDVSVQQMRSLADAGFSDQSLLDSDTIETLATVETALVDTSYDTESEFEIDGETESFENTVKARYLVAVEDGEWKIVLQQPVRDQ